MELRMFLVCLIFVWLVVCGVVFEVLVYNRLGCFFGDDFVFFFCEVFDFFLRLSFKYNIGKL